MTTVATGEAGKRSRRRKLKAILAGGLVLGLGATVTLAAWNDSEYAEGTFTTGHFNMEGSTDNVTFADHATAPGAAALTFSTGFDNMSPDDVVAAPFVVRLAANTTSGASVAVAAATPSVPAFAGLTYGIATVAAFADCDPTPTNPTWIVTEGHALDSVAGASTFNLAVGSPTSNPGASVFLCMVVTADAALVQDTSVTETWQFLATST